MFTEEEYKRPHGFKVSTTNETLVWDSECMVWRLWRREHGQTFSPHRSPYLCMSFPEDNRRRAQP